MFTCSDIVSPIHPDGFVEVFRIGGIHYYKHSGTGVCFTVTEGCDDSSPLSDAKSIERATDFSLRR